MGNPPTALVHQGRQERQGKKFVQGFCVSPVPFGLHWDALNQND
ncbi:MAG: hypothetical protein RMZ43_002070 [Nostoc sp. CmiVER01]|nr:hypothetical protein [Nostoc sp. CmiVER01]